MIQPYNLSEDCFVYPVEDGLRIAGYRTMANGQYKDFALTLTKAETLKLKSYLMEIKLVVKAAGDDSVAIAATVAGQDKFDAVLKAMGRLESP